MSHNCPMARHCMPQKQTHQIAMIALRSAAPVNGGLGPERLRRVPSAAMAASSASTASTKASTSLKAFHEAGEVLAGLKAVPICCGSDGCCDGRRHSPSPSRASAPIHPKVASRSAPTGTPRLRTDSEHDAALSLTQSEQDSAMKSSTAADDCERLHIGQSCAFR